MFLKVLMAMWGVVFASVLLLGLFPRLLLRIPHLELIRPMLLLLILATVIYGGIRVYSEGMKRARR